MGGYGRKKMHLFSGAPIFLISYTDFHVLSKVTFWIVGDIFSENGDKVINRILGHSKLNCQLRKVSK